MTRIRRPHPMDKPDYYIASARDAIMDNALTVVQTEVNTAIARGYEPVGGISVIMYRVSAGRWVKHEYANTTYYGNEDDTTAWAVTQGLRLQPVS